MRKQLRSIDGQRKAFTGHFEKYGIEPGWKGVPKETILLTDIRDDNNKIVRKVDTVTEITGTDINGEIELTHKYKWDSIKDEYKSYVAEKSNYTVFKQISELRHIPVPVLEEEMKKRITILDWMVNSNITEYDKVADIIQNYYTNPEQVLSKAKFEDY